MPERVAQTQLTEFTRIAGERTGRVFGSYADLHRWSIESPGDFWQLVWDYTGVIAAQTPDEPVADLDRHYLGQYRRTQRGVPEWRVAGRGRAQRGGGDVGHRRTTPSLCAAVERAAVKTSRCVIPQA